MMKADLNVHSKTKFAERGEKHKSSLLDNVSALLYPLLCAQVSGTICVLAGGCVSQVDTAGETNHTTDTGKPYPIKVSCPGPEYKIITHNGAPAFHIDGTPAAALFAQPNPNWSTGDMPKAANGVLTLTDKPDSTGYRTLKSTRKFSEHYATEVTVKMLNSTEKSRGASLAVQVGKEGNYLLSLAENNGAHVVNFWKEETGLKGYYRQWVTTPSSWECGKAYRLKIEVDGNKITGYVDDQLVGTQDDPNVLKPGAVQLSVYHAVAEFGGVRVSSADGKTSWKDDFSTPCEWNYPLRQAKAFKDVGVHVYTAAGWGGLYLWDGSFLSPENKYDFKKIDQDFARILKSDPDAVMLPRVSIAPPPWWRDAHPGEMMTLSHASGEHAQYKYASYTSKLWLDEVSEFLRQYIRHLNSQPYAGRIAGFTLMVGGGGECVYSFEPYYFDYSNPQLAAYRNWLAGQYKDNASLLGKAWNDPAAAFDSATIPTPAQKNQAFDIEFRDPVKARPITDYMRFHSIAITSAIDQWAKVVKEETDGKKLVFVFYGYLFNARATPTFFESGHLNYNDFLQSPHVDCVGSLHDYEHRQSGGVTISAAPVDSAALYGKMPFSEEDPRTHLCDQSPLHVSEGRTRNLPETLNVIKRDFAYFLSKSSGFWYMDWGNGWLHDDAIMDLIGKIRTVTQESLARDRRKNDEIAVIVSDRSYDFLRNSKNLVGDLVGRQVVEELTRIGAPFATYHLSALDKMPDHKLYIFLNAFHLSEQDRKAIETKVKDKGKTALWLYAPGYACDEGLSVEAVSALTGMKLTREAVTASLRAETVPGQPITAKLSPPLAWGNAEAKIGPVFYCDDKDAATLAVYRDTANAPFAGKPAMAVKEMGGWRSIWCGVPAIPAALLREIARSSGAHIYSETDDFLVANRFMVSLHAKDAGEKAISLPGKMHVFDAFSKRSVAQDANSFTVHLDAGETGFWMLEK